ncbi:hypothetical protein ACIQF6_14775 [Kitasatospora sp. NPDC092948]|uniref:hypothetical protein n=1 Tax=Kitasatospora sp. NPDC092948 TaxID=3364088 RepID=UPI0038027F27
MTALPPDVDALVRGALTAELGSGVTVMTLMPDDWARRLPLVVARTLPGTAAVDPRGVVAALVDLQIFAAARPQASEIARRAWRGLYDACMRQHAEADAGGYLSHFSDGSTLPAELRTGVPPAPDAATFRFQATVRLTARPASTP